MTRSPFTSTLIEELAHELSIKVELEPRFRQAGVLQGNSGKRSYFKLSTLDVNPSGSAKIATDKDYASFFLHKLGYTVPEGQAFFSDEWCRINGTTNNAQAAGAYALKLGFPVIVKPNSRAQGNGVHKVYGTQALNDALVKIFLEDNIALVQRPAPGRDYRFVVYNNQVPIVYERTPLALVGNGETTVENLLKQKFLNLYEQGRAIKIEPHDPRIYARLRTVYNYEGGSVLKIGERLQLLDNANMSAGGEARDVSDMAHPSFTALAKKITYDMGLRLCGVDLMTEDDITKPMRSYVVLEINDHPGLEHYAAVSNEAASRVRALYTSILRDLTLK